jgi:hypothetical protein
MYIYVRNEARFHKVGNFPSTPDQKRKDQKISKLIKEAVMWIQSVQMQVRIRLGTKAGHNSEKNTVRYRPAKKALQQTFRKIRMQQPLVLTSIVDLIPSDRH